MYLVQLSIGVYVAILAFNKLGETIGYSLELDRLSQGFDRSVFSDLMNEFPKMIELFQNQFQLSLSIFLIVSIFLHAGLLGNIKKDNYSVSQFFNNGKEYVLKFFVVALITVLKMGIILFLIWKPFISYMGDPLQTFHSDKTFILTTAGVVIFTILLLMIVWMWSVLTRFQLIEGGDFIRSMKNAWFILKSSILKYFVIGVLIFLLHVVFIWLYTLIVDDWGASTWLCVLGLIFIQQLFSIGRIWIRVFAYCTINEI